MGRGFLFASCRRLPCVECADGGLHRTFVAEDGVRFVSITTDPQNDTPAVLQQYAARFGADSRWVFLTGEKSAIWQLSRDGFKLAVAESPGEREPITHSTRLVLVDKNGMARGFYEGVGEEGPARIEADIRRLLAE